MSFVLFNTLTGKKEKFIPLKPPAVLMYVCGPTVYDFLHIGNFRGAVFYNVLCLWLEHLGFKVRYFYNFTDIDDKIIQKAKENNTGSQEISQKYIKEFCMDFDQLGLKSHTDNPRATQYIPQMIALIQELVDQKKAYVRDGHVFYRVRSFKKYGCLSHRKLEDLYAGSQVSAVESKENEEDFALWKKSKEGEPFWDSPWGKGRPGWHIECTAMIHHGLGERIDIHGGGMDLIFPHHENEIAQSEGCKKGPFVKYWVHHNMFEFEGEKISKSLGAVQTMRAFLKEYNAEIFKYLVLNSHYRSVIEVSGKTILQSISGLSRVYQALLSAQNLLKDKKDWGDQANAGFLEVLRKTRSSADSALNDDLNTAKALAGCFSLVRFFNDYKKSNPRWAKKEIHLFLEFFKEYGGIFSLFLEEPQKFLDQLDDILLKKSSTGRKEITKLIEKRAKARESKDFKTADQIRQNLWDKGVEIQDLAGQTTWRMNPSFFISE